MNDAPPQLSLRAQMKVGMMSSNTTPFLSIRNLAKNFGMFRALRDIDTSTLVVVPPPFHIPSFTFVLVWHKRRGGDQALNWLKERIAEGIEG